MVNYSSFFLKEHNTENLTTRPSKTCSCCIVLREREPRGKGTACAVAWVADGNTDDGDTPLNSERKDAVTVSL